MKRNTLILILALLIAPTIASAETWVVDPKHSEVSFRVRHLVTQLPGRFMDYSGVFELDPENLENSSVSFIINAESITTNHEERDAHLRSKDFLWVEEYSTLSFRSQKVRKTGEGEFEVTGILTIRGVGKVITVDAEFLGFVTDPGGVERGGFETQFKVNRKDFGLMWSNVLEAGGAIVGDTVKITLNLELIKQQ